MPLLRILASQKEQRISSQQELAERTGLTVQPVNQIFKGGQPITYETANKRISKPQHR